MKRTTAGQLRPKTTRESFVTLPIQVGDDIKQLPLTKTQISNCLKVDSNQPKPVLLSSISIANNGLLFSTDLSLSLPTSYTPYSSYPSYPPSTPFYSHPSIIYVTKSNTDINTHKSIDITGVTDAFSTQIEDDIYASFPLCFPRANYILIPKKLKRNLERYVPKELLKKIDSNISLAIEKCLVLVSNLASTYYSDNRWKKLSSTILHEQTKKPTSNTYVYKNIITALLHGTPKDGPMIEILKNEDGNDSYQVGIHSKYFKLSDNYFKAGLTRYIIQDESLIKNRQICLYNQLKSVTNNPIVSNLLSVYPRLTLPTLDELILEARRLISKGYKNKKGKKLTFLNKHSKSYFTDSDQRSFVEENIELFNYLTQNGFLIPTVGDIRSGGRVVDSFTLMPSWIRKMIKIDKHDIVEVDYRALHPNIAIMLYGGKTQYITHQMIADELEVDKQIIKKEHLSFFNQKITQMKQSPLYSYYKKKERDMLNDIMYEKRNHKSKHKVTSKRLFECEARIMSEVLIRLNSQGIYALYVYDALYCKEVDALDVIEVMNQVALEFGVYTTADCEIPIDELITRRKVLRALAMN
ncbi:MAG: hypothetical protein O9297_07235 [Flavobacterium sp.]|uniref:hypothetical protein n=1 Tax=Flavobacterium sp. TaxID=239 RepID=UPI0022C4C495|nr:hypothetical protein [Flavobacterium sp.]MCZ8296996.1 hypothetical protein [Flavobacterium sp.]